MAVRKRSTTRTTRHVLRRRNLEQTPGRVPVEETNLTEEERALLPDPNWVTEDDADYILGLRSEKKGGKSVPLEKVLKRYGYRVEG